MPVISPKIARELLAFVREAECPADAAPSPDGLRWVAALEQALRPKRSKAPTRQRREAKRQSRRERTAEVRAAVMERAGGICECGCGTEFREPSFNYSPQLDHFRGRARGESVESCWALTAYCHEQKTRNEPDAAAWLRKFAAHCRRHGYDREAQLAEARLSARGGEGA